MKAIDRIGAKLARLLSKDELAFLEDVAASPDGALALRYTGRGTYEYGGEGVTAVTFSVDLDLVDYLIRNEILHMDRDDVVRMNGV